MNHIASTAEKSVRFIAHYLAYNFLSRKLFLKLKYRYTMHKSLNIETPCTLNEKIQWLKLYWDDKRIAEHTDKYLARDIVKNKYSADILNDIYAVYETADQIEFDSLPQEFVLKVSSGCGFNIFCRDKNTLNIHKIKKQLKKWQNTKYWIYNGEWVYSKVKPVIICEKLIKYNHDKLPVDYKFFCFNGVPKFLYIATERATNTRFDFFDLDFNHIPVKNHYPNSDKEIIKPDNFSEMVNIAKELSKDLPFVRVDLYSIDNKVIFGEFTFFHMSGSERFEPEMYDYTFGEMLDLSLFNKVNMQKI